MAEEVNAEAEKEKRRVEHAMKDDEKLKETMKWKMPGPHVHKELPKYKSFNRYYAILSFIKQTPYLLIVVIQLTHLHVVLVHKSGSALWRI